MKNLGPASRARQTGADPHRAMARASTDASTRASRGSVEVIVVDEDVAVEEEEEGVGGGGDRVDDDDARMGR